jgi:hypothetical protein
MLPPRGLGCSPFAHHYLGNHSCFLFLLLLRCFSSKRSPPTDKSAGSWGFPIRISADLRFCAAPRSFSQLYTSFIACRYQGIHRVPFLACCLTTAPVARPSKLRNHVTGSYLHLCSRTRFTRTRLRAHSLPAPWPRTGNLSPAKSPRTPPSAPLLPQYFQRTRAHPAPPEPAFTTWLLLLLLLKMRGASRIRTGDPLLARQVL